MKPTSDLTTDYSFLNRSSHLSRLDDGGLIPLHFVYHCPIHEAMIRVHKISDTIMLPLQQDTSYDGDPQSSPSIGSDSRIGESKLELPPLEIQQNIFQHYFKSFEIKVMRTYMPDIPREQPACSSSPTEAEYFLSCNPFPGQISLVLVSSKLCGAGLLCMDETVTTTYYQPHSTNDGIPPIIYVKINQHPALADRIVNMHLQNLASVTSLYMKVVPRSDRWLLRSIKVVELDYDIGYDPDPDSLHEEQIQDHVEQIIATAKDESSFKASEPPAKVRALLSALARTLCDWREDYATLTHTIWYRNRWFDMKTNVTGKSNKSGDKLQFTLVVPFNDCRGTCPSQSTDLEEYFGWRDHREKQGLSVDCTCVLVRGLKITPSSLIRADE